MTLEVEVAASGKERRQGFAAMDPERRRALQAKGGRTAQARGRAPRFGNGTDPERAGRKGGKVKAKNAKRKSRDPASA